jgi:hypothetical protein
MSFPTRCEAGKYQNLSRQSFCRTCPVGNYQNSQGQTGCLSCPAGYYCPTEGMTGPTRCEVGKYQNLSGQILCKTCPSGFYCPTTGMTGPTPCDGGRYQSLRGQNSCEEICSSGFYCDYNETNGTPSQIPCPAGKYQPNRAQRSCEDCPAGSYCPFSSTGTSSPTLCRQYTSTPATGGRSQDDCNPVDIFGFYGTKNAEKGFSYGPVSTIYDYSSDVASSEPGIMSYRNLGIVRDGLGVGVDEGVEISSNTPNARRIYMNWDIDGLKYIGGVSSLNDISVEEYYQKNCHNNTKCGGVIKSGNYLYTVDKTDYAPCDFKVGYNSGQDKWYRYRYRDQPYSLIITPPC